MDFKIILERDEDGWIVATCPSLPGCVSQGRTEKQAIKNMKQAVQLHIQALAQDGLPLKSGVNRREILVSVAV